MTRKAILIESSKVKAFKDLPGARLDVKNWKNFLTTDLGGRWFDSEIVTLNNPLSSDVERELKVTNDCYCFVAFSGHGSNGSVALNDSYHDYPISSLKPKTEKGTLIVDACRGVTEPEAHARRIKFASLSESVVNAVAMEALEGRSVQFASAADSLSVMDRAGIMLEHRSKWEHAVNASIRGTVEMQACSKGQDSGEDAEAGGYYTSLLMQSAERWDQMAKQAGIHSTKDAHDYAVKMLPPQQTPEYAPSWLNFPFAVKI